MPLWSAHRTRPQPLRDHRRRRRQHPEADAVPTGRVVAVNKTYVATAAREGQWWVITVDGIGVTQSRTLRDASSAARGLISAMLDVDDKNIEVHVEPALDPELAAHVQAARKQVADLDRLQRDAAIASREAAHALILAGVSGADAATVLGVSPQRVSQLLAPANSGRTAAAPTRKAKRSTVSNSAGGTA